jgi:NADH-quinone oxidoreductase subunit L
MPNDHRLLILLGMVVVASPLLLTFIFGVSSLLDLKLTEERTSRLVHGAVVTGLTAAVAVLALMLTLGTRHVSIDLGHWVVIPRHYHFSVKFVFDRLSVPFVILSFLLSGVKLRLTRLPCSARTFTQSLI